MIGVDLAKSVFQLHAASMTGQPKFRKKMPRSAFTAFMAAQPPAVIGMEVIWPRFRRTPSGGCKLSRSEFAW